jgi:hypothetical protein
MAQAFVMTTIEPWIGDRRALWVVLADTPDLALETARTDGCHVDEVVGTLSEETVERLGIQSGRALPPPWRADRIPGGYVVRDDNGQAIAYIYSRENRPRRGEGADGG